MKKQGRKYKKNIVRKLHDLKHTRKRMHHALYFSQGKRNPEGLEVDAEMKRDDDALNITISVVESLLD